MHMGKHEKKKLKTRLLSCFHYKKLTKNNIIINNFILFFNQKHCVLLIIILFKIQKITFIYKIINIKHHIIHFINEYIFHQKLVLIISLSLDPNRKS